MDEEKLVENAALLTRVFGEWPSFHDAEVLTMHLDRAGVDGPSLEACVHVFRMTREVDARGHYVLTHHTQVTLRFVDILLLQLRGFDDQNSLSDLDLEEVDPSDNAGRRFSVCFGSNVGVESELLCNRIVVQAVEPFDPLGNSDDSKALVQAREPLPP
jgi:hypothetical protein